MTNEEGQLWRLLCILGLVAGLNADIGQFSQSVMSTAQLAIAHPLEAALIASVFAALGWLARK